MLWMETYLFYCSVRLGVIVIGVLTFVQLFIPDILFFVFGIKVLDPIVELFENDASYKENEVVKKLNDWIENDPLKILILLHCYLFLHMITCILLIFGAWKLKKWLLIPFTIIELVRVIYCLTWHIVLMIMLKKILNLGVLIAYTLLGGFLILYLAYNWATSVALFQIINLINTQRYKALYGDDPFAPQLPKENVFSYGTIENVRVLLTPSTNDIDEQKQKNSSVKTPKAIIAVLPANYNNERAVFIANNARKTWWQQTRKHDDQQFNENNYYNDYTVDYGNWQWSELPGAPKKSNALLTSARYMYRN